MKSYLGIGNKEIKAYFDRTNLTTGLCSILLAVLGLVMIIVGEILWRVLGFAVLGMHFLGLGVIIALFGLAELAIIRRDEND